MYRTLVGLTGDDRSAEALLAAGDLSSRMAAELGFVHACERQVHVHGMPLVVGREPSLPGLRSQIVGRIRGLINHDRGLSDRVHVKVGGPSEVLSECARLTQADVLFLGRQRRAGAANLGSTQSALLTSPPCALWFQGGKYIPPRRVILRSSDDPSAEALAFAGPLAAQLGLRLDERGEFDGDAFPDELVVVQGGVDVAAQAARWMAREVTFLVVPAVREEDDAELESIGYLDPDVGFDFA